MTRLSQPCYKHLITIRKWNVYDTITVFVFLFNSLFNDKEWEWFDCTLTFTPYISVTMGLMGHMPCFDTLIRRVGPCKDFIDRVLQVQDAQLIKSEKGVGSVMPVTKGNTWVRSANETERLTCSDTSPPLKVIGRVIGHFKLINNSIKRHSSLGVTFRAF